MNKARRQESAARKAPENPTQKAMARLIHKIARDAIQAPRDYLNDARVPAGGE